MTSMNEVVLQLDQESRTGSVEVVEQQLDWNLTMEAVVGFLHCVCPSPHLKCSRSPHY